MAASSSLRMTARQVALAALLAGLTALPALAQTVPMPAPRPQGTQAKAAKPAPAPSAQNDQAAVTGSVKKQRGPASHAQAEPEPTQAPAPFANPFAALLGQPGSTTALKPKQRAIIERVNAYLSGTAVLSGNFVQVGPDGRRSQGEFFIQKPGRVRFDYNPPSPIDIIADGQTVVVRDRKLATQDVYPLSQTPLRFLLSDRVNLLRDTNLVAVYADDVFITVVVEEKAGLVGTSRLMIMFAAKDMQLKQWTVTDPQGFDTTVAVYNLDTTKKPDPSLFRIDFTNYRN